MCCAISAPTPIASPSPTPGWSLSADGNVTFRWRDSAHGNKKRLMTLAQSMSSCAAFCSICCRPASCASATSASSPTGNAPLSCRSASNCSAAQSNIDCFGGITVHRSALTHSGTVRSAVAPCTSSNGSPPRNSCFALHLNQTGAQHEPLSTSSAFARAPARTQIPCLISAETTRVTQSLQPSPDVSLRCFIAPSGPQSLRSHPPLQLP